MRTRGGSAYHKTCPAPIVNLIVVPIQVIRVVKVLVASSAVVVVAALDIMLNKIERPYEVEVAGVAYMMSAGVGIVSFERAL